MPEEVPKKVGIEAPPPIENPQRFRIHCERCGSWINGGKVCAPCQIKEQQQKEA